MAKSIKTGLWTIMAINISQKSVWTTSKPLMDGQFCCHIYETIAAQYHNDPPALSNRAPSCRLLAYLVKRRVWMLKLSIFFKEAACTWAILIFFLFVLWFLMLQHATWKITRHKQRIHKIKSYKEGHWGRDKMSIGITCREKMEKRD